MENEIKEKVLVPGPKGTIENPGWARTEVMEYTRSHMKAPWFGKKEWDYYLFTNEEFGVAFTISDLGYVGLLSVSFLDFIKKVEHTETELVWFPKGKVFGLGTSVDDPHAECHTKRLDMVFSRTKENQRHISCDFKKFDGDLDFKAELDVFETSKERMYICTPWKEKKTAFYYNCKFNNLEAEGTVDYGEYHKTVNRTTTLGVLDWGRGIWTYDNTWYWGTGSGRIEDKPFGFNLGYGFTDRSSASENVIFYDGKVHKLEDVVFDIPKDEKGNNKYMDEWRVYDQEGRLNSSFKPILDRRGYMNFGVILTDQHQVFGKLSGTCTLDDGTELTFKDYLCAIEVVRNKY